MTNDVEYLLTCAAVSLVEYRCSARKENRLVVFLLSFENSLYILDTSPLADIAFEIFSSTVIFLSIFLTAIFEEFFHFEKA